MARRRREHDEEHQEDDDDRILAEHLERVRGARPRAHPLDGLDQLCHPPSLAEGARMTLSSFASAPEASATMLRRAGRRARGGGAEHLLQLARDEDDAEPVGRELVDQEGRRRASRPRRFRASARRRAAPSASSRATSRSRSSAGCRRRARRRASSSWRRARRRRRARPGREHARGRAGRLRASTPRPGAPCSRSRARSGSSPVPGPSGSPVGARGRDDRGRRTAAA